MTDDELAERTVAFMNDVFEWKDAPVLIQPSSTLAFGYEIGAYKDQEFNHLEFGETKLEAAKKYLNRGIEVLQGALDFNPSFTTRLLSLVGLARRSLSHEEFVRVRKQIGQLRKFRERHPRLQASS